MKPGMLRIITTRSSVSTGSVRTMYRANTSFTQGFRAGNLLPCHPGMRRTLRRNGPIWEKKSGMPVRSASAQ